MDIAEPSPYLDVVGPATESVEARNRRIAYENKALDVALASIAAGRWVTEEQFDAWVDSLGTDRELPVPKSGR